MDSKECKSARVDERRVDERADLVFYFLSSIFIASLIVTNLIAGKHFTLYNIPFSCTIITYPFTFLITDIIAEVYGPRKAHLLVLAGIVVTILITLIILLTSILPISEHSPISNNAFKQMFGVLPNIVLVLMITYLFAQLTNIRLFEFFRQKTKGNHLWIRNNCSTLCSQMIDTIMVALITLVIWPIIDKTSTIKPLDFNKFITTVISQYTFKALLALLDTPFVYLGVNITKKLSK
jgi:uncharacterized integral membrane protein (TIGR00697 family)